MESDCQEMEFTGYEYCGEGATCDLGDLGTRWGGHWTGTHRYFYPPDHALITK